MSMPPGPLVSRDRFDGVLFDLDGVLTATAKIHSVCWKRAFDEFLTLRTDERGEPFRPFDISTDYLTYVDGKPRYDGVRSFLASRGVELPEGEAADSPGFHTICAVGNYKSAMVAEVLAEEGVEVYPTSIELARRLREHGFRLAVVSSSKLCREVLQSASIDDLFELCIDGVVAERDGIAGKPAPDTFLAAAHGLGISPQRCVVVEDAISGVQAGRAGGFGLVVGIARHGDRADLERNGADVVVDDLAELALAQ